MSDIVERLRASMGAGRPVIWHDLREAAAEIERLRAEVERYRARGDGFLKVARGYQDLIVAERNDRAAEVERLRAAGDALAHSLLMFQSKFPDRDIGGDALEAWEARHD